LETGPVVQKVVNKWLKFYDNFGKYASILTAFSPLQQEQDLRHVKETQQQRL